MKKRKVKKSKSSMLYIGSGHFQLPGTNVWKTDRPAEK